LPIQHLLTGSWFSWQKHNDPPFFGARLAPDQIRLRAFGHLSRWDALRALPLSLAVVLVVAAIGGQPLLALLGVTIASSQVGARS